MMFFPGSTGVIYRQFSVTVIASMLLSVLVAAVGMLYADQIIRVMGATDDDKRIGLGT